MRSLDSLHPALAGALVGIVAMLIALALVLVLSTTVDTEWAWHRFALIFSAIAGFLLLSLFTRPGVDLPQHPVEMRAREESGNVSQFQPDKAGSEAIGALLPPFLAVVTILLVFGF